MPTPRKEVKIPDSSVVRVKGLGLKVADALLAAGAFALLVYLIYVVSHITHYRLFRLYP